MNGLRPPGTGLRPSSDFRPRPNAHDPAHGHTNAARIAPGIDRPSRRRRRPVGASPPKREATKPMTRDDPPGRLVRALLDLVDALDRDRTAGRAGRAEPSLAVPPGGAAGSPEPPVGSDDEVRPSPTSAPVSTRETDDGLIVVATLPGVAEVDLSTDLDREVGVLALGVDGEVVDRVPLEVGGWTISDVSFNDGALEVTLDPA